MELRDSLHSRRGHGLARAATTTTTLRVPPLPPPLLSLITYRVRTYLLFGMLKALARETLAHEAALRRRKAEELTNSMLTYGPPQPQPSYPPGTGGGMDGGGMGGGRSSPRPAMGGSAPVPAPAVTPRPPSPRPGSPRPGSPRPGGGGGSPERNRGIQPEVSAFRTAFDDDPVRGGSRGVEITWLPALA